GDLQEEADDGREPADPAEQAAAKQHAEQTRAEESRRQPTQQARPIEEPATRRAETWAARLRNGAVERLRRVRRRRRARRRRERSPAPGTRAEPSAGPRAGRRDPHGQRQGGGRDEG